MREWVLESDCSGSNLSCVQNDSSSPGLRFLSRVMDRLTSASQGHC